MVTSEILPRGRDPYLKSETRTFIFKSEPRRFQFKSLSVRHCDQEIHVRA